MARASSARFCAELVHLAREAGDEAAARAAILAIYRRLVPYDRAVLTAFDRHDAVTAVDVDGASLDIIRRCERQARRYAPEIDRCFQAARARGGCLDSEIFTAQERHELPVFREIIQPQGVRSTIVLTPRWRGRPVGMIRLERGAGRAFGDRDLCRAVTLLPAVELALAAHRRTAAADDRVAGTAVGSGRAVPLGPREAEVAYHVGRGLTSRQIALVLGTSPLTVRNQTSRIFDKLGVASRAELAAHVASWSRPGDGAFAPYRSGPPPH